MKIRGLKNDLGNFLRQKLKFGICVVHPETVVRHCNHVMPVSAAARNSVGATLLVITRKRGRPFSCPFRCVTVRLWAGTPSVSFADSSLHSREPLGDCTLVALCEYAHPKIQSNEGSEASDVRLRTFLP